MKLEDLGRKIREAACVEGDFTLKSGRKSHYIIDKYAFETRPELLSAIAKEIAGRLDPGVKRIAGVELGGVPLATAVSLVSGIPFVIVKMKKKGYGTDKLIEGAIEKGDSVALIEDVGTTGGTVLQSIEALKTCGAGKVQTFFIVDREEGLKENMAAAGHDYVALFTRTSLGIAPDQQ
ncbi:MAG TPA: orotate phosphoribosyltransferase [Candidatus Brocadiia bacterium]|nr:orotate phosphoribosyltransferase [Candidatus Brocadiia bacterium]